MTRLNPEQEQLLKEVAYEYDRIQPEIEELRRKHEAEVWELKKTLRDKAAIAAQAGVPARQIGFAIRTSDHKTVKRHIGELKVTEVGD